MMRGHRVCPECVEEVRAFVRFGGYALDLLPRVAGNIFKHYKVKRGAQVEVLTQARVPLDIMNRIDREISRVPCSS